jgi:hypothetical protein
LEHAGGGKLDRVALKPRNRRRATQTISTFAEAKSDLELHSYIDISMLPSSFIVMNLMADGRHFQDSKPSLRA